MESSGRVGSGRGMHDASHAHSRPSCCLQRSSSILSCPAACNDHPVPIPINYTPILFYFIFRTNSSAYHIYTFFKLRNTSVPAST